MASNASHVPTEHPDLLEKSDDIIGESGDSLDKGDDAPKEDKPTPAGTESTRPVQSPMPILLARSQSDKQDMKSKNPISPVGSHTGSDRHRVTFEASRTGSFPIRQISQQTSRGSQQDPSHPNFNRRRTSLNPKLRPEADAYYDSRAATRKEFRRRATTLQDYYRDNPTLLPQLPFTFRHGFKRWKLALLIMFMIFDASIVPILLNYAMTFGGNIQGYITFAVVTAIWGGPAYFEFAVRSWRLILKERFFRPLGVTSRWSFDITNWIFVAMITVTTTLLIIGAAPHIVWLRVLSMPGPALLLVLGICLGLLTIFSLAGWRAPFRISSTPKGEKVNPGVYYIVEDIVAVNANGGLPFREGLAARYEASPVFRKMIRDQSLFWSIGAFAMGIALTVIICVHSIDDEVVYGVGKCCAYFEITSANIVKGWATPFVWAAVWAIITVPWVRYELHRETLTWDSICKGKLENGSGTENGSNPIT